MPMRVPIAALAVLMALAWSPTATAHGALEINQFDTYAISDFEGQEDSFPWEGWEIWDVYAGDGYLAQNQSHGVYFKANLAGDGTARPTQGETWEVSFSFNVGNASYERIIVHDGTQVHTDFERLEWQIADGNVFQLHAWVPVPTWDAMGISDLVVVSSVDGQPRDTAPGGVHDPATGEEVPVSGPSTGVFPAMGEGRIVEEVALTGAAKYLNVTLEAAGDGAFTFLVSNPLEVQGQHVVFLAGDTPGWTLQGALEAQSVDGGDSAEFTFVLGADDNVTVEPLRLDILSDIGGLQSYYAYVDDEVRITQDPELAVARVPEEPVQDAPGWTLLGGLSAVALALVLRRR